jgi:hypothetical protein
LQQSHTLQYSASLRKAHSQAVGGDYEELQAKVEAGDAELSSILNKMSYLKVLNDEEAKPNTTLGGRADFLMSLAHMLLRCRGVVDVYGGFVRDAILRSLPEHVKDIDVTITPTMHAAIVDGVRLWAHSVNSEVVGPTQKGPATETFIIQLPLLSDEKERQTLELDLVSPQKLEPLLEQGAVKADVSNVALRMSGSQVVLRLKRCYHRKTHRPCPSLKSCIVNVQGGRYVWLYDEPLSGLQRKRLAKYIARPGFDRVEMSPRSLMWDTLGEDMVAVVGVDSGHDSDSDSDAPSQRNFSDSDGELRLFTRCCTRVRYPYILSAQMTTTTWVWSPTSFLPRT